MLDSIDDEWVDKCLNEFMEINVGKNELDTKKFQRANGFKSTIWFSTEV